MQKHKQAAELNLHLGAFKLHKNWGHQKQIKDFNQFRSHPLLQNSARINFKNEDSDYLSTLLYTEEYHTPEDDPVQFKFCRD